MMNTNPIPIRIVTPTDWLKTNVTNPAYMWLGAFAIVSCSSFITGSLVQRYKYKLNDNE